MREERGERGLTFELLLQLTTTGDGECADELLEVDCPVLVLVKDIEHVFRECGWIAKGEELFVDLAELLLVELARRAVLEEPFIPVARRSDHEHGRDDWKSRRTIAGAPSCQLEQSR